MSIEQMILVATLLLSSTVLTAAVTSYALRKKVNAETLDKIISGAAESVIVQLRQQIVDVRLEASNERDKVKEEARYQAGVVKEEAVRQVAIVKDEADRQIKIVRDESDHRIAMVQLEIDSLRKQVVELLASEKRCKDQLKELHEKFDKLSLIKG